MAKAHKRTRVRNTKRAKKIKGKSLKRVKVKASRK